MTRWKTQDLERSQNASDKTKPEMALSTTEQGEKTRKCVFCFKEFSAPFCCGEYDPNDEFTLWLYCNYCKEWSEFNETER